ncbi:MAG: agmatine deiminase family protein [Pseudomonadota bacterium]|nr:agmatine deiminase family protein [Pseudomonadota bacterium]MEE3183701.1 agmatine deiminase family protein [Pseudomonadota bacterium]|tara:strand:+ start:2821 stop:3864 length:1044 start_codon:yes stop_codon:yes gene_type:complete
MSDSNAFFMPSEWSEHKCCWMAWPPEQRRDIYPNLEPMRRQYANVASTIAEFEPVMLLATTETVDDARRYCSRQVEVIEQALDDAWLRDIGPTFVLDKTKQLSGVDWQFNCWGDPHSAHQLDATIASVINESAGANNLPASIFLEGGAIHSDGDGLLLTTENVVLNPNRNPGLTRLDAEGLFRDYLGAEKVVWLDHALEYDDTDGHVDNLACFSAQGVVLALSESDPEDPNYARLRRNIRTLSNTTTTAGDSLNIIEIRQPARQEYRGERLPLSYINFYIANGGVILPEFNDPMDQAAVEAVAAAFPDRAIVQLPAIEITKGGGCIHCITQQQPKALPRISGATAYY